MTNAQPEPSMEEILASIRRIISEDEEDQPDIDRGSLDSKAAQASASSETSTRTDAKADSPTNNSPAENSDDALTKMLDRAEFNRNAGISPNAHSKAEESEANSPKLDNIASDNIKAENLKTKTDAENNNTAHVDAEDIKVADLDKADNELETEDVKMVKSNLATASQDDEAILDSATAQAASAAFGTLTRSVRVSDDEGQTLEAMVENMLRPLVKDWLDANLSRIVEEKVEYEVQRLARRG